jgi:hypothetical protein
MMAVKADKRARTSLARRSAVRSFPVYLSADTARTSIENRVHTCERTPERDAILGELIEVLDRVPTYLLIAWIPIVARFAELERREQPRGGTCIRFARTPAESAAHSLKRGQSA